MRPRAFVAALALFSCVGCGAAALVGGSITAGDVDFLNHRVQYLVLRQCESQHPDWGVSCERVAHGETWIGMTREQVLFALGTPTRIESKKDGTEVLVWLDWRVAKLRDGVVVSMAGAKKE